MICIFSTVKKNKAKINFKKKQKKLHLLLANGVFNILLN